MIEFLESISGNKIESAINTKMNARVSATIFGNYFPAEAFSAALSKGFKQTMLTRHAPSKLEKIKTFEDEFFYLLKENERKHGWKPKHSKENVTYLLKKIVDDIDEDLSD